MEADTALVIQPGRGGGYELRLRVCDDENLRRYRARLVRLGDFEFLDLLLIELIELGRPPSEIGTKVKIAQMNTGHIICRVSADRDTLRLAYLDEDRFEVLVEKEGAVRKLLDFLQALALAGSGEI